MTIQSISNFKRYSPILSGASAIFFLYLLSLYNYHLFHVITQIFSTIVAYGIFVIAWNSRRFLENNYLLLIGIAYLFIGSLDFVHIFVYERNLILHPSSVDISSLSLVLARYLQGISFLFAPFLIKRRFSPYTVFGLYLIVFLLIVLSDFRWNIFSEYVSSENEMLSFNRVNSSIIFLIFIVAMSFLNRVRAIFDGKVFNLIYASLLVSAAGEIAFIISGLTYSYQSLISVLLNIVSFYLIYKAIIETGFSKPYHLLFRDLKQSQERYGSLVEYSPEAIGVYTNGEFVYMNSAGLNLFGAGKLKDIIGKKTLSFIHSKYRDSLRKYVQKLRRGESAEPLKEFRIVRLDGGIRYVEAVSSDIVYEGKRSTQILIRDITDRKRKEAELKRTNEFNQTLLNTIPFAMDIVDEEGNILFINRILEKKFGKEIIRKKCWEIYKDNQKQCERCPLKNIKIGETANIEVQNIFGEKVYKITHTGINFQNKTAIMEIFRDITEQKSIEKIVQDARVYAESIVNTVREPLVVLDKSLRIVSANWAFYYTFRFLREKSEKGLFYEIYNNYWDIPVLKENLEKVIKNNIPIHNLEISHNFPEIGQRIMMFNGRRIYQVHEQSQRFLLSIRDITEKKRSEEQLRQSEEKYRNIFDNASDGIVTIDLEDNITSWNKSAEKMLGWTHDEIIGKKFGNLIVPEDLYAERGHILENAFAGKYMTGIETIRIRKDRTEINVSITTSPIYNEKREIVGMSGIIRDITLQKQNEMKLKLHAKKLEKLTNDLLKFQLAVEHASDLIMITDKEGAVLYANQAAVDISGYSKNEIIGKKAGSLWGKQMSPAFYEKFWNIAKEERRVFIGEVINKRKNGDKYYAEMRISPIINDEGDVIFFVGIERDITKEKEINKAKTEFVSVASHELRTPLANMSLSVEMILDSIAGPLNPEQKKYLRGIYRDIKGMSGLVDALLNVSRIELRTLVIAPEPANLHEIAESVLKEITPQINKKELKISRMFDPLLPVINIDRNLMRIILQNLLTNAIKYTPVSGKIGIEIRKDINDALIKVSDNGCGIPEDQQGKIFQKLFRARNAIDLRVEGVGLGLYIVKSIVVQCGGKIWIESEENKGTTFFVKIPLEGMKKNE